MEYTTLAPSLRATLMRVVPLLLALFSPKPDMLVVYYCSSWCVFQRHADVYFDLIVDSRDEYIWTSATMILTFHVHVFTNRKHRMIRKI